MKLQTESFRPASFCLWKQLCSVGVALSPAAGKAWWNEAPQEPGGGRAQTGTQEAFYSPTCRYFLLLLEHSGSQGVEGKQHMSRLVLKFIESFS